MSLPCAEESRMRNKVNKGKIRLWLWSVSSPRFLAWLVRNLPQNIVCFGSGLVIYKRCTKPHSSECCWCEWRWEECFLADSSWPLSLSRPKNFWSLWLCKPFSYGSLPFSDCFSDISHPSHVSLYSSELVGWILLGGDGWCHLCWHRILMDQAENYAVHLLRFLLPPSSAFSTVLEQGPEPCGFALCLHLTVWRPCCSHLWVLALPCWVFQSSFQLLQLKCRNISASAKHPNKAQLLHPPA